MGTRLIRSERAIFREIGGTMDGVLLDLDSGEYRRVNHVGSLVWHLLAESPTREDLTARLRDYVNDPPPSLETEVDAFLEGLVERRLAVRV